MQCLESIVRGTNSPSSGSIMCPNSYTVHYRMQNMKIIPLENSTFVGGHLCNLLEDGHDHWEALDHNDHSDDCSFLFSPFPTLTIYESTHSSILCAPFQNKDVFFSHLFILFIMQILQHFTFSFPFCTRRLRAVCSCI